MCMHAILLHAILLVRNWLTLHLAESKTKQNPYFVSSTADFVFTFQIFGSDDDDDDMRERSPEKEFIPFPSSFFIQLGPLDLSGMLL